MNKQIKIQIALIIGIITALIYGYASFFLAGSIVFTIGCIAIVLLASYLLSHFRITYYPKGRRI